MRRLQGALGILLNQDNGHTLGRYFAHDFKNLGGHDGRQTHRRFVQQQHLGFRHQCARHRQHLLLAAAHGAGQLVFALLQTREERKHFVDIRRNAAFVIAGVGAHEQILGNAHAGENAASLRHHDQTLGHQVPSALAGNVAAYLIKIFNLQKKENFNRFKKNIDDGYTAWFIYRFYYKQRCIESTIYPFEYSIYERDQTYGIQDFKKRFTSSAWKALVKIPACRQFSLSRWYQSDRALEILAKCLHVGTDTHALEWLDGFISKPVSMDLIEEILLFLKKCDKSPNTLSTAAKDIIDHIGMWDSLQKLKIKYPEIVKNLGVPLSGKWSLRRFADEHSRLSQMKRDCDREQILEKERREKWKKKNFFNIHKFPQLKGTTITVDGSKLDVKLINDAVDLFDEGSKMRHCIFDYISYMRAGIYFAFSITDSENPRNCCTIAFSVQNDYESVNTIYGTPTLNTNYNEQKKKIVFDQVRGLRNHVMFSFNQDHLVNEMHDFMKATGFHDYITGLSKRPLAILKQREYRIKRVEVSKRLRFQVTV